MYDDIVSKLLQKAEFLYGKRVPGFIIDGVEIDDEKAPCIYYPFNNNHVIILITEDCRNNEYFATFQIAHEVVHCLCPNPKEIVTYLEEGLAVYFQLEYANESHLNFNEVEYIKAVNYINELFEYDNDIIRKARMIEPNISKITGEILLSICPQIDKKLLSSLTTRFYNQQDQ